MKLYNKIVDGIRVETYKTRKQFGVGENSPEEICNERGYFLVIDHGVPSYNKDTHKLVERRFNFDGKNDIVEYIINEKTPDEIEAQRKALIPKTITPRQARLALLQATLLDEVEAMVATDKSMSIWWEYSLEVERNSEHIINAGLALGLTEEQLDNLFIEGSKL